MVELIVGKKGKGKTKVLLDLSLIHILEGKNAYTEEELSSHGLPKSLSKQEILQIAIIRYQLNTNSFKKYMPVTIATNVSEESVAAIMENQNLLQGIDVVEAVSYTHLIEEER